MLSVLRLISFKYFFASLVIGYMRLFCSCFFTSLSIQLCCLNKCPFKLHKSPTPSLRGRYNLFTSDLGGCIQCIVKSLRILVSTFLISVSDQLIIVKLYVTTGSAKELIASILLRVCNSLLRIDLILLTLQKHSFRIFSLIEDSCIPSTSVTPRYL